MRDNVSRTKTTYSTRNAGGGEQADDARVRGDAFTRRDFQLIIQIIVDIREMGALLPSLIDAAGIKVVPATLTIGDYIISPKMCIERKALPDLEASFANGRLCVSPPNLALLTRRHTQVEGMTAHYEICILLIEFEEDKYGLRVRCSSFSTSTEGNAEWIRQETTRAAKVAQRKRKRIGTSSTSSPNSPSSHCTSRACALSGLHRHTKASRSCLT